MLILMGAEGEILKMGTIYVQVLSGVFHHRNEPHCIGNLRGIGRTTPIMVNNIIRSLVNIVLDYILIFENLASGAWNYRCSTGYTYQFYDK